MLLNPDKGKILVDKIADESNIDNGILLLHMYLKMYSFMMIL